MTQTTSKKKYFVIFLLIVAILLVAIFVILQKKDKPSGHDSDVKKLSEVSMNVLSNYELYLADNSYSNHNGYYTIDDAEIVERVAENFDSLYIKECDSTPYMKSQTRGLEVRIGSKDGSRKGCSVEILGKNEKGNDVLSLAILNEEVVEVVEGELDYEYLKELYENEVKENGGTLEGDKVED